MLVQNASLLSVQKYLTDLDLGMVNYASAALWYLDRQSSLAKLGAEGITAAFAAQSRPAGAPLIASKFRPTR